MISVKCNKVQKRKVLESSDIDQHKIISVDVNKVKNTEVSYKPFFYKVLWWKPVFIG